MSMEQILEIPLDSIQPNDGNRRYGGFDPTKLQELAESIKAAGVLQPAVVRERASGYELVAGERRWRAANLAGLETLPCVVRKIDDVTVLKIQTIENLQREDIHPLDEAEGYARLIDRAGYDVEHLAQEVGRSPSYVYQRLKLRELVPEARQMLVDGKITAGHAILIARLQPKTQTAALKELMGWRGEPISVRALDDWIHRSVLMELSKACWKLDDETLVLKAGSCKACPKRTGFQPALFADVCNGGKTDYCTDRVCFSKKQQALVALRRKELGGVPHLEAVNGWTTDGTPKGALRAYDWSECKKGTPGAQRVLIVAGETPGRLTYGKPHSSSGGYRQQMTPEQKAEQEKEERKRTIEAAFRKELYSRTVAAAQKKLKQSLNKELLRLAIQCLMVEAYDSGGALQEAEDWGGEEIALQAIGKMDEAELRLTLLKLTIAQYVEYSCWRTGVDPLLEAAKLYQVDLKAARKEAANQAKLGAKAEAAEA